MEIPAYRAGVLESYAYRYGLDTLIETGLYNGKGSGMLTTKFATYIAIDRDPANVEAARANGYDAWCGDSGTLLQEVLALVHKPALFFLDAHGVDCGPQHPVGMFPGWEHLPLLGELRAIAAWEHGAQSVVLIDDMPLIAEWIDLGLDTDHGESFEIFLDELPVQWERETRDGVMRLTPL